MFYRAGTGVEQIESRSSHSCCISGVGPPTEHRMRGGDGTRELTWALPALIFLFLILSFSLSVILLLRRLIHYCVTSRRCCYQEIKPAVAPAWQADLEAIRSALLQRRGALVNLTADGRALAAAGPEVAAFLDALPAEGAADEVWTAALPRRNEAICVPTQARPATLPRHKFLCVLSFSFAFPYLSSHRVTTQQECGDVNQQIDMENRDPETRHDLALQHGVPSQGPWLFAATGSCAKPSPRHSLGSAGELSQAHCRRSACLGI